MKEVKPEAFCFPRNGRSEEALNRVWRLEEKLRREALQTCDWLDVG